MLTIFNSELYRRSEWKKFLNRIFGKDISTLSSLNDVPSDGKTYGVNNAVWTEIISSNVTKVGSGETYTTIRAAQLAGYKNIELTSDVTETVSFALIVGTIISSAPGIAKCNINMATRSITASTACIFSNINFTFSYSGTGALFSNHTSDPLPIFNNVEFINNSTIADAFIASRGIFNNCKVTLPNYSYCGFGGSANNFIGTIDTLTITGGGASCQYVIFNSNTIDLDMSLKNITMLGTYGTTALRIRNLDTLISDATFGIRLMGNLSNVTPRSLNGNSGISVESYGDRKSRIVNAQLAGISNYNTASAASLTNCFINSALTLDTNETNLSFSNCTFLLAVSDTVGDIHFSNCLFTTTLSLGATKSIVNGCRIITSCTVTGDNNILNSNIVGNSGTGTITFNAGGDNNICMGNQTDVAIVNSGTGNQLGTNVVF